MVLHMTVGSSHLSRPSSISFCSETIIRYRTYSTYHIVFLPLVVCLQEICLDTIILSSSSGGARLAEPCYRRRVIDLDRSNPFLDAALANMNGEDPELEAEMEVGDEKEAEILPFNWFVCFSVIVSAFLGTL